MDKKKPTNGQLQRRIDTALIHVDKTKDTKSVFYDDKGMRIIYNEDFAIIETNYHHHVFSAYSGSGVNMPWVYIRRLVELTLESECNTYDAMLEKLRMKEDKSDYNFAFYVSWWLFNLYHPLYTIGNTDAEFFNVYEDYIHNIAKNTVILKERNEDLTNKAFIEQIIENVKDFTKDIEEVVILEKKTDEEYAQENLKVAEEIEIENAVNEQIQNEGKD